MSRDIKEIVKDLCSFDSTSTVSKFRCLRRYDMIFVGRLTSHEHFDKLTKKVQNKEEIQFFLKYTRQANGQIIEEKTTIKDKMNEAPIILFYLVKSKFDIFLIIGLMLYELVN
ncbi:unnamed protein product [Rotaria sp. Silwood1]|nr:unnamed protein product [Rotaria sp. Silwood1]